MIMMRRNQTYLQTRFGSFPINSTTLTISSQLATTKQTEKNKSIYCAEEKSILSCGLKLEMRNYLVEKDNSSGDVNTRSSSSESEEMLMTSSSGGRPLRLNSQEDTEEEDLEDRFASMSLDDLDIIKTIGMGTFGKVVLSQDRETGDYYALKITSLFDILQLKQLDHIRNERDMLGAVRGHPFIVNMMWHGKDEYNIYFLLEYAAGGELFSYLRKAQRFSTKTCAFYTAEMICALEFLHQKNICHRDLKPENLLLNKDGHLKITDFGFAKRFRDKTWTVCGTAEYLAPEVIEGQGYTKAVDWWALGILIHEMLAGYSPFYHADKLTTYEKIMDPSPLQLPHYFDSLAKDLIKRLLVQDRTKRLGFKNGAEEVKTHKFFRDFDWLQVYRRKLTPPIIPNVYFEGDTGCFNEYPNTWAMHTITEQELDLFADF